MCSSDLHEPHQDADEHHDGHDVDHRIDHGPSIAESGNFGDVMASFIGLIELRIAAIALICLGSGVALCLYTLRLWKEARPESPALAPLEVMSDDEYVNGDERTRRDLLHMAREIATGVVKTDDRRRAEPRVVRQRPAPQRRVVERRRDDDDRHAPIDPLLK